jgi:hypothetical protein
LTERTKRARLWRTALVFLALLGLGLIAVLATNDVSTALTQSDRDAAQRMLRETGHGNIVGQAPPTAFDEQVNTILAVQDAVLSTASERKGIPFDRPREPADLYAARSGLCFDRSRAIEKILMDLGFEVRHAAVYSTKDTGNRIISLLTPQTPSHAVTEVKTARGWLVVDPNRRWIGLTHDGEPVDLETLQHMHVRAQGWDPRVTKRTDRVFRGPFTYVIGLYSRHGRFYPPYNSVPDIDWGQIPDNFGG